MFGAQAAAQGGQVIKPSTAAILNRLGAWIGWFGNAIGLPIAILGLISFWTAAGETGEKALWVASGIFIFGLGRVVRYIFRRAKT